MESIAYELINNRIELSKIQSDYDANNKIYFRIEKTSKGNQVYFFNPEFAFEKQLLINADTNRVITYLKIAERYPEEYQKFVQDGFVYVSIDNNHLNLFVMHTLKQ